MKCIFPKTVFAAGIIFSAVNIFAAEPQENIYQLNFENKDFFAPDKITERGLIGKTRWRQMVAPGCKIRVFPDKKYNQVLELTRPASTGRTLILNSTRKVAENCDYTISADFFMPAGNSMYLSARGDKGVQLGGVQPAGGNHLRIMHQGNWKMSGFIIPPDTWCHIEMKFSPVNETYTVTVTLQDGTMKTFADNIMKSPEALKDMLLGINPPAGTQGIVDNITVVHNKLVSTAGRSDLSANAEITASVDNQKVSLPYKFDKNSDINIVVDIDNPVESSSLEVTGSAGLRCRANALNIGGQRVVLATPIKFIRKDTGFQTDFAPSIYQRITFNISGNAGDVVEKIAVYSKPAGSQNSANLQFASKLQAELELPVFQNETPISMRMINLTDKNMDVKLAVKERYSGKIIHPERTVSLSPGKNDIAISADGLKSGEYFVEITESGNAPVKGMLRRLLRRQIIQEPPVADITGFTGEKLYFADKHFLESTDNVNFKQGKAEGFQVSKDNLDPDSIMQHGETIYMRDGKICIGFFSVNGKMAAASKKRYLATADPSDLSKWEIKPVEKDFVHPQKAANDMHRNRAQLDNAPKTDANGNVTYRYYDPTKDGKIKINQVEIKSIGFARPGDFNYAAVPKINGTPLPPRTTWVIWHKEPGLSLVVGKEPLLADGYPGDFETGKESNDNMLGQYFSDDSKQLFYARGCLLRRYEPFNVPYENFVRFDRILTVFKTTDGINFERIRISLPENGDPAATQHYGGYVFQLPQGNGLRIGYLLRYFVVDQRYGIDLNYSYDGFVWKRFPGQKLFLDNGPMGSWNAGSMHLSRYAVNAGDKTIHLINWATSSYHFYSDGEGMAGYHKATTESVKKRLQPRQIEKWPFFKSYEHLAEDIRNTRINVGVMVLRKDGFFYAEAKDAEGRIVTRKFTADGSLSANAIIADNGEIKISLLNIDNSPIAGFEKTLTAADSTNIPVFSELPDQPFKIMISMRNASLYTLNFNK